MLVYNEVVIKMNMVNQLLKNSKISLFFDEQNTCILIYVFHYQMVLDYCKEYVKLQFATIKGSDLFITRMEDDQLEIRGKIEKIIFHKEDKDTQKETME